ncbi:unnamed protein product, partial [Closterium sp. NIES-65]
MLPFLSGTTQGPYGDSRKDVRAGAHWLSGLGKAGAGGAAGSGSAGGGGGNCTLRLRQITLEDIWTAKLQVEVQHEVKCSMGAWQGTAQEEAAEEKASPAAAKLGGAPTPPLGATHHASHPSIFCPPLSHPHALHYLGSSSSLPEPLVLHSS